MKPAPPVTRMRMHQLSPGTGVPRKRPRRRLLRNDGATPRRLDIAPRWRAMPRAVGELENCAPCGERIEWRDDALGAHSTYDTSILLRRIRERARQEEQFLSA